MEIDNKDYTACAICGVALNYGFCRACKDHQQEYRRLRQRKLYAARKAAGCCVRCGKPVMSNVVRCRECAEKNKKRGAEYYKLNPEAAKDRVKKSRYKRRREAVPLKTLD